MNKEEHIQHWLASAEESWESALYLAKGKHFLLVYLHCIFLWKRCLRQFGFRKA